MLVIKKLYFGRNTFGIGFPYKHFDFYSSICLSNKMATKNCQIPFLENNGGSRLAIAEHHAEIARRFQKALKRSATERFQSNSFNDSLKGLKI